MGLPSLVRRDTRVRCPFGWTAGVQLCDSVGLGSQVSRAHVAGLLNDRIRLARVICGTFGRPIGGHGALLERGRVAQTFRPHAVFCAFSRLSSGV